MMWKVTTVDFSEKHLTVRNLIPKEGKLIQQYEYPHGRSLLIISGRDQLGKYILERDVTEYEKPDFYTFQLKS